MSPPGNDERRPRAGDGAHDVDHDDDNPTISESVEDVDQVAVEHAQHVLDILRNTRPPARPACPCGHDPADDATCIRHNHGNRSVGDDYWLDVTGVFVPHRGGVRMISLRDHARGVA